MDGPRGDDSSPDWMVGEQPVYQHVIWPSTKQSQFQRGVIKASKPCSLLICISAERTRTMKGKSDAGEHGV